MRCYDTFLYYSVLSFSYAHCALMSPRVLRDVARTVVQRKINVQMLCVRIMRDALLSRKYESENEKR